MKLRTEMRGGVVHVSGAQTDAEATKAACHDATAAHALLQAIADWHEKNGTGPDEDVYPSATVDWITKRAAEILAGWLGEERG